MIIGRWWWLYELKILALDFKVLLLQFLILDIPDLPLQKLVLDILRLRQIFFRFPAYFLVKRGRESTLQQKAFFVCFYFYTQACQCNAMLTFPYFRAPDQSDVLRWDEQSSIKTNWSEAKYPGQSLTELNQNQSVFRQTDKYLQPHRTNNLLFWKPKLFWKIENLKKRKTNSTIGLIGAKGDD